MKKPILIVAILGALFAIVYLSQGNRTDSATAVEIGIAQTGTVRGSILASGTIAYREQVQLRPEVVGKVQEILVEEGEPVSANQLLMRIDPETFKAQVEQNEANVRLQEIAIERQQLLIEKLETQMRRKEALFEQALLDKDSFQVAQSELKIAQADLDARRQSHAQAKAQLNQAREQLDKTYIRSPMDGIVTSLDIKVGETVIAGTTNIVGSNMLAVADTSVILTEVFVDEADIARVALGQDADVYAVAYPDTPLHGTVTHIATSAKQQPGRQGLSFLVKIVLDPQSDTVIRPGMSSRTEIFTQSAQDVVTIPLSAIRYKRADDDSPDQEEQPVVYIVNADNTVTEQEVQLGLSDDEKTEVISGLSVDTAIVIGPYREVRNLSDGQQIQAQSEDSDADDTQDDADG